MTVDARAFRHALGQFASGITVVTTRDHGGQLLGLTVSAFCSVSLHPPLVLVCVDARSETHAAFVESKVFGVSVLADDQDAISERFAPRTLIPAKGFASEYRCWISHRKRAPSTERAYATDRADRSPANGFQSPAVRGRAGPTQRERGAGRRRKAR